MLARALFDPDYYLERNPIPRPIQGDPFDHFMSEGWRKGFNPHPLFDLRFYSANAGLDGRENPLLHYLELGPLRSESPHPLFRIMLYWKTVPPWSAKGRDTPLESYLKAGWKQGVNICPFFDPAFYLAHTPGIPHGMNPFIHFLTRGWKQGRPPSPYFDTKLYLRRFPALLRKGINPLEHFITIGAAKGIPPHPNVTTPVFFRLQECPRHLLHLSYSKPPRPARRVKTRAKGRRLKKKLIFMHIPKTAGTSIQAWLSWNLPPGRLITFSNHLDPKLPGVLRTFDSELCAVGGHIFYGVHRLFESDCAYFTLLRHPVARLVSWYRHAAISPQHPYHREIRSGMSFSEFLRTPSRVNENLMTRMIAGLPWENHPAENDPEVLRTALENVQKDFCLVGTVSHLQRAIGILNRALNFPPCRIPYLNSAEFGLSRVTRRDARLIQERNELDLKLFARFEKRMHVRFT